MNYSEQLTKYLDKYINETVINSLIGVYFIKKQVAKIRNMKIEIYANDHNPPHFHVKSNDLSINATFRLDNCSLINGKISNDDLKRIKAFYDDTYIQSIMRIMWNDSKHHNKKVFNT